jgi:hypothetical protein
MQVSSCIFPVPNLPPNEKDKYLENVGTLLLHEAAFSESANIAEFLLISISSLMPSWTIVTHPV